MKINSMAALSEAVKENLRLKAEIAKLKKSREALKSDMTAYLKKQKLTSVTLEGTRVSYMPYSVTRFDVKLFEQEHAKLYKKYMKTDWFTKLTVTPKKEAAAKKKPLPCPRKATGTPPNVDSDAGEIAETGSGEPGDAVTEGEPDF